MLTIDKVIQGSLGKCIFCHHKDSSKVKTQIDGVAYDCPNCGYYEIAGTLVCSSYPDDVLQDFFCKAPAIAAERKLHGQEKFSLMPYNWQEFISNYPNDFIAKMDRALVNLALKANSEPKNVMLTPNDFGLLFIEHNFFNVEQPDLILMLQSLTDEGMITHKIFSDMHYINLTVSGLKRVAELRKSNEVKEQAFIAMWFDETTADFRAATKDAITAAGYKPEIVDENYHNDFIMNKVINMINDSRFVVADLTSIPEQADKKSGVRGGVYFEAGYAEGRGLPVILTCQEDAHSRVHFDLQQKSTILWSKDEKGLKVRQFNYVEYLIEHIIATIGKGPLFDEKKVNDIKLKYN